MNGTARRHESTGRCLDTVLLVVSQIAVEVISRELRIGEVRVGRLLGA